MTPKQRKVLKLVADYATPGMIWPTIDELILVAGSSSSKQAMQHTLRSLEEKGLIRRCYERRGDRVNLVVEASIEGLKRASALAL